MNTVLIIQARMGSSRLPGKILMPLGESTVLGYVVSRCKRIGKIAEVIVATTTSAVDDQTAAWCKSNDVVCFRGSEDDVLSRYYECAKPYAPDYVIRVVGDSPFFDHEMMDGVIEAMERQPCDIVIREGEPPRGVWMEMVAFSALEFMYQNGHEPRHREHVTYYAYDYPQCFAATTYTVSPAMRHPELRITVDTPDDYAMLQQIAANFAGDPYISTQCVVDFLLAHPEVVQLNAHVQHKPVV